MRSLEDWQQRLLVVIGGTLAGFAAKTALTMSEGKPATRRVFVIDTLLFGIVVLMAFNGAQTVGLSNNAAALLASFLALSSEKVIRAKRDGFSWKPSGGDSLAEAIQAAPSAIVPAGVGAPSSAEVKESHAGTPAGAGIEHLVERKLPVDRDDFDALIEKLDAEPFGDEL